MRDIDTAVVDSLKVLDPNRPIREATELRTSREVRFVPLPEVKSFTQSPRRQRPAGPARFPNGGGGRHGAYGRMVLTARNGTDGIFVRV